MIFRGLFPLLFLLMAVTASVAGERRSTIAVMDFGSAEVPERYVKELRDRLEYYLYKSGRFRVLEREKIDLVLRENLIREKSGRERVPVSPGKTLAADYAVTGKIVKRDGKYLLRARIVSIRDGSVMGAYTMEFETPEEIKPLTQKVSGEINEDISYYRVHGRPRMEVEKREKEADTGSWFFRDLRPVTGISFGYILPRGEFGHIAGKGYGFTLNIYGEGIAGKRAFGGLDLGYAKLEGSGDEDFLLLPLMLTAGYRFPLYGGYFFSPKISGGMEYITGTEKESSLTEGFKGGGGYSLEPVTMGTMGLGYGFGRGIALTLSAGYGVIFEKGEDMAFYAMGFGISLVY